MRKQPFKSAHILNRQRHSFFRMGKIVCFFSNRLYKWVKITAFPIARKIGFSNGKHWQMGKNTVLVHILPR